MPPVSSALCAPRRRPGVTARPPITLAAAGLTAAGLALGLTAPLQAREPVYPSRERLRELQLATFSCGRDNLPGDCEQARLEADPLLDHPRLPGSCKDALWQIREHAVAVPQNSFERRDRLDRAAQDLMRFCPRDAQPPSPRGGASGPQPAPGFGFRGGGNR